MKSEVDGGTGSRSRVAGGEINCICVELRQVAKDEGREDVLLDPPKFGGGAS